MASLDMSGVAVGVFCGLGAGETVCVSNDAAVGVFCGVAVGEGVCDSDDAGVGVRDSDGGTNIGRLGIGRSAGVSPGFSAAAVIVGNIVGAALLVELRCGPRGESGRTASKYCVADLVGEVAAGVEIVSLGAAVAPADSVTVAVALASGDDVAGETLSLGDSDGVGVLVAPGDDVDLLFLRGLGEGVGREKSLLNLSTSESSCSGVPRAMAPLNATAVAMTMAKRSFLFTQFPIHSAGQFREHGFVHLNSSVQIFERKIFVR
ncbi:MAG TPA: hypothetical protein VH170_00785 [Chthoniobacterales bacterium]|jgi:hypothetical protein|nr:hypothetical protein [Chthoniobacterales bacterium]